MYYIQKKIQNTDLGTCQSSEFFIFFSLNILIWKGMKKWSISYLQDSTYNIFSNNSFLLILMWLSWKIVKKFKG